MLLPHPSPSSLHPHPTPCQPHACCQPTEIQFAKLQPAAFDGVRGLAAKNDMAADEIIVSVPRQTALTLPPKQRCPCPVSTAGVLPMQAVQAIFGLSMQAVHTCACIPSRCTWLDYFGNFGLCTGLLALTMGTKQCMGRYNMPNEPSSFPNQALNPAVKTQHPIIPSHPVSTLQQNLFVSVFLPHTGVCDASLLGLLPMVCQAGREAAV